MAASVDSVDVTSWAMLIAVAPAAVRAWAVSPAAEASISVTATA
jgi:hypothetical protein